MKGAAVKIVGVVVVAMSLGVAGGVLLGPRLLDRLGGGQQDAHAAVEPPGGRVGVMHNLKERVVNLADPGVMRYLKIGVVVEFEPHDPAFYDLKGEARQKKEAELNKELAYRYPILADILISTLSSKTSSELLSTEGKERLKEELRARFSAATGEDRVIGVHFTEFIIQ